VWENVLEMQFSRAVGWIAVTAVLFSAIGAFVGWLIGTKMPGYYRSVFGGGSDPSFDPVAVGFGQGLTQGLILGASVGLVLVLANWWKEAKLATLGALQASAPARQVTQVGAGAYREQVEEEQGRVNS
jgi:hypothetical protein